MRTIKKRDLKKASLSLTRKANTNSELETSDNLYYLMVYAQAIPYEGIKKSIRSTKLVRSVTIIKPSADSSNTDEWVVVIRTDMNQGKEEVELVSVRYCDFSDSIGQLEPGMFVTIEYYEYLYDFLESIREEDGATDITIIANKVWIDHEKTEADRVFFDFGGFGDGELDHIVSHKDLFRSN